MLLFPVPAINLAKSSALLAASELLRSVSTKNKPLPWIHSKN
jgi:hypothetical protein